MCIKESDRAQSSTSDEPYLLMGIVTPFRAGAYQSKIYSYINLNKSNSDLLELYRERPNGTALIVRLMGHDGGDRDKYTEHLAKALTSAHALDTATLRLIPVDGVQIAAIAGPLVQNSYRTSLKP